MTTKTGKIRKSDPEQRWRAFSKDELSMLSAHLVFGQIKGYSRKDDSRINSILGEIYQERKRRDTLRQAQTVIAKPYQPSLNHNQIEQGMVDANDGT